MFDRILVVCIGNICRSPMAEQLLKIELPQKAISSAGLGALVNAPADDHAQALMTELGHDISQHRGRQINAELISQADLILVMTQKQEILLTQQYPQARGRVYRLGHWDKQDIADPYQKPREAFELALQHIQTGIASWLPKLR